MSRQVTDHLDLLQVAVGDVVGLLYVHHRVQAHAHQGLPERGQQVQPNGDVRTHRDTQHLKHTM